MSDSTQFDIFDFLGIEVTENLETVQKTLDSLPASKMAELKKNPAFSSMRSFLFAKRATPAYIEYVRTIRDLRGTNVNRNQKPNQTNSNQPHLEETNTQSEAEKQREWIRQYEQRVKEMNNRNGNNNTNSNSNEQNSNERNPLKRLANQLNQMPERKTSPAFTFAWFFNTNGVIFSWCAMFLSTPILDGEISGGLFGKIMLLLSLLIVIQQTSFFIKTWRLLRTGYFTPGYANKEGEIDYTDDKGVSHHQKTFWHSRLLWQTVNTVKLDKNQYMIIIDKKDPNQFLILDCVDQSLPEYDAFSGFHILNWFFALCLPIKYDALNRYFTTSKTYILKLLAIILGFFFFLTLG